MLGRYFDGDTGMWGPVEDVNLGQTDAFTPDMDLAADLNGVIYAAWEYWGTGRPQAWYSARQPGGNFGAAVPEPSGMLAALAGTVVLLSRRRAVTRR